MLNEASTELLLIPAEFSQVQDVVFIVIILLFYKTGPLYLWKSFYFSNFI